MIRKLRIIPVLRRNGAALPMPPDADALAAVRRCEQCPHQELCEEVLASSPKASNLGFCPNAPYVAQLRDGRLKF